jgi:hypothetical protein
MTKITKPIIRLDMTENAYFIMSVCRKAALKNGMAERALQARSARYEAAK